ncbi:F-box/LRR-repeat protein 8-like [Haliotis rubra]|uniref:F-box/LRR-repeat protein 8-like n=1 Tax=Haliotis rubra TaxID=36100 RepID=UPI001EE54394|nr:F-box/LRR-repeat protein 8-like [Haliotis rubra]
MESLGWALPEHIVINVLSYLSREDRARAGSTCTTWHRCYKSPMLWHVSTLDFQQPKDGHCLQWLEQYAQHIRTLRILLDQSEVENRRNACEALKILCHTEGRKLTSLRINFTGTNPLFYAGQEFIDVLKTLFGCRMESQKVQFRHVDLSGLSVAYDDSVFDILSLNTPQLETLNVLNGNLVCKVSPECVEKIVQRCRCLTELRLFHCSLSDGVLYALAEADRKPLKHLSVLCRREQKYAQDLSSEAWSDLIKKSPQLRVVLGFDHTCPLRMVAGILKPEIPVVDLRLETFTYIYDEVNLAAVLYNKTLEKVVLQTRNSSDLGDALIKLCSRCERLTSLLVYCVLEKRVVDAILAARPDMKKRGTYILKWEPEPEPWTVGVEEGD